MVRHVVLWKLRDGVTKAEALEKMNEQFKAFEGKVPGLRSLQLAAGFAGYDICLVSEHEDRAALEAYQNFPAHVASKGFIHSVTSERAFCDFELEE